MQVHTLAPTIPMLMPWLPVLLPSPAESHLRSLLHCCCLVRISKLQLEVWVQI
jgi:hypothetical protein